MDLFHGGLLPPRTEAEKTVARMDTYSQEQHRAGINAARRRIRENRVSAWTPTIQNCDTYMDERTGKYEFRAVRYNHTIDWMLNAGLKDGMTVFDVGSGMGEFGFCLMHDHGLNIRYIPVDGGIDGVNLNNWTPPREAHFFVALELVEHLTEWRRLLYFMQQCATIGVAISTPNPFTTDVLGMDPTHTQPVWPEELEEFDMTVSEQMFYGGVFSDGKPDSLFATWRRNG